MHNALTIALTGGIGSGKSTLGRMLVEQGAALIDTDAIARELMASIARIVAPAANPSFEAERSA